MLGQTHNLRSAGVGKKNILSINYALLAVTKHEQWQLKHMHAHTQACIHMCTFTSISSPHSQICLLLLSKPAVKSSIICIRHLHTAASLPPSLPPSLLSSSPARARQHSVHARTLFVFVFLAALLREASLCPPPELSDWMTTTLSRHISFVHPQINNFFSTRLSQRRAREPHAPRCEAARGAARTHTHTYTHLGLADRWGSIGWGREP